MNTISDTQNQMETRFSLRPRIKDTLNEAIESYITAVIGASGYGKTKNVSAFVQEKKQDTRVFFFSFRNTDNDIAVFWKHLQAACNESTKGGRKLDDIRNEQITKENIRTRVTQYFERYLTKEPLLFVFDHCDNLENEEIRTLLEQIAIDFSHYKLSWIVIAQNKESVQFFLRAAGHNASYLGQHQLAFTAQEANAHFRDHQISLSASTMDAVMDLSAGWPIYIDTLAMAIVQRGSQFAVNFPLAAIEDIFWHDFFKGYDSATQKGFVVLSFLDVFTNELIEKLMPQSLLESEFLNSVERHAFIYRDPITRTFSMQKAYRNFLQKRAIWFTAQQKNDMAKIAGQYFLAHGFPLEALKCCFHSGKFEIMSDTILSMSADQLDADTANLVQDYIRKMPAQVFLQCPSLRLFDCLLDTMFLRVACAQEKLQALIGQMQQGEAEQENILCQSYILLAFLHILQRQDDFDDYICLAHACFSPAAALRTEFIFLFTSNYIFYLSDTTKRELEVRAAKVSSAAEKMDAMQKGFGGLYQLYFECCVAYHQNNLGQAETIIRKYMALALLMKKADLVLQGHWILLQIFMLRGDIGGVHAQAEEISEHVSLKYDPNFFKVHDYSRVITAMMLRCFETIPAHLLVPKNLKRNRFPLQLDEERILHAYHLLHAKEYKTLLPFLDAYERECEDMASWTNVLRAHILRAIAHMRLDEDDHAVAALYDAYTLSYKNDMITAFIGSEKDMRGLIQLARASKEYTFHPQWLDKIQMRASTYAKRVAAMRKICVETWRLGQEKMENELTSRETQVLTAISQGLTRDEISESMQITSNTVKTITSQIYNKLNAVNNADAVRIGFQKGILG